MALYTVDTVGATALSAATAKTLVAAINSSAGIIRLVEWGVFFDGISASAVPVLIEVCSLSTTAAGTATSHTIVQSKGPTRTAQFTAKRNYTVEPTTITVIKPYLCHAQAGMVMQAPLGRETDQWTGSYGLILRVTAPATVNARAYMEIEEG